MKFSIIVPVYNVEKYITDCVNSVLDQSFTDFELLLIDDGSKDRSGVLCDELARDDNRISVFHKPNSGQIETRKFGVEKASGAYILFLDSDDIIARNMLETVYQKIQKYHCDMVVFCHCRFQDGQYPDFTFTTDAEDFYINDKKQLYLTMLEGNKYNSLWSKAIKKEFLQGTEYSNYSFVRYGEDLLQGLDVIKQNPKTVIIHDVLYGYRMNPDSVSNQLQIGRYVEDHLLVRKKVYETIMDENFYDNKDWIKHRTQEIELISDVIGNIAVQIIPFKEKKIFFEEIRKSELWNVLICCGPYLKEQLSLLKRFKHFLFVHRLYRVLVLLISAKNNNSCNHAQIISHQIIAV